MHMDTSQESIFAKLRPKLATPQDNYVARACAVEMHIGKSQQPCVRENLAENAAPQTLAASRMFRDPAQ